MSGPRGAMLRPVRDPEPPSPEAAQQAERIGPTAHYTAYVWRRLGLPHAEHLATRQGAVLYWGFFALGEWATRLSPSVPSMREFLEYRHRLIDAVVDEWRPGCVVELGAGLTPRAVRWAADRGVPGIELDLPAMARAKQLGSRGCPRPCARAWPRSTRCTTPTCSRPICPSASRASSAGTRARW